MMIRKTKNLILIILTLNIMFVIQGCKKDDGEGFQLNLFTVQDDVTFGMQVRDEIASNPADFPVLKESQFPDAYDHIYRIRDSILNTGLVEHDDLFEWELYIIHNDTVLNAFATPGGYLYFYTGLINFLDNESEFAGVLAHEIAHAARRHSTEQLTKVYGIQLLLGILLGENSNDLAQIAADLASGLAVLAFSRNHEYESDEYSVKYLYETSYDARGAGGFFQKLDGQPQPPEFMSTHPHPDNRYERIVDLWAELGGKEGNLYEESYQQFKSSLP